MCTTPNYGQMYRLANDMWPEQWFESVLMTPFLGAVFAHPPIQAVVNSDLLQPIMEKTELKNLDCRIHVVMVINDKLRSRQRDKYLSNNLPSHAQHHELPIGHGAIIDAPSCLVVCIKNILHSS